MERKRRPAPPASICEGDHRLKTVAFSSNTPEAVIERERREAEKGRGDPDLEVADPTGQEG